MEDVRSKTVWISWMTPPNQCKNGTIAQDCSGLHVENGGREGRERYTHQWSSVTEKLEHSWKLWDEKWHAHLMMTLNNACSGCHFRKNKRLHLRVVWSMHASILSPHTYTVTLSHEYSPSTSGIRLQETLSSRCTWCATLQVALSPSSVSVSQNSHLL